MPILLFSPRQLGRFRKNRKNKKCRSSGEFGVDFAELAGLRSEADWANRADFRPFSTPLADKIVEADSFLGGFPVHTAEYLVWALTSLVVLVCWCRLAQVYRAQLAASVGHAAQATPAPGSAESAQAPSSES